jgi:uncharacterized protein
MKLDDILIQKRGEILRIAAKHGVTRIRVFGSAARGDCGPESDVDFLIEVGGPTTPWFPGGLVAELEEILGRRVDVVEPDALRENMKDAVLREAVPL